MTVERIDAIVLAGGSAFGLDAASGVRHGCANRAAALPFAGARADRAGRDPVRSLNGGDKDWGRYPPYRELGYAAAAARGTDFALGSVGAGLGATTVDLKGGARLGLGA